MQTHIFKAALLCGFLLGGSQAAIADNNDWVDHLKNLVNFSQLKQIEGTGGKPSRDISGTGGKPATRDISGTGGKPSGGSTGPGEGTVLDISGTGG